MTALVALAASDLPASAIEIDTAKDVAITISVEPERIRWGEEVTVTVVAVNRTGKDVQGGLYISFDQDVLVLDVKGGKLHPPGSILFDLSTKTSKSITRPMVEAWGESWKSGAEARIEVVALPLRGPTLRVLSRVTLVDRSTGEPRMWLMPDFMGSRARDETGFPAQAGYVWISQASTLRRAVRKFERRVKALSNEEQRRFALALADALENPSRLSALGSTQGTGPAEAMQTIHEFVPRVAARLRQDHQVALEKLRCVMASMTCSDALVYFGVPAALFEELSAEENESREIQRMISGELGADIFVLLAESYGFRLSREGKAGEIVVQRGSLSARAGPQGPFVLPLLRKLIEAMGAEASVVQASVNGMSFAALAAQLEKPK